MGSPHPTPDHAELLSAYLDDELTAAERLQVEDLLAADPSLQAELAALTHARSFLGRHGPQAAPDDFLAEVLAATQAEPERPAWFRRPFGLPVEALAVAAAALLVIWVALPTDPAAPPSTMEAPARPAAAGPSAERFTRVPFAFHLLTEDPRALHRVAALAAQHRGDLSDARHSPIEVQELSGTDAATVIVRIPADALPGFSQAVRQLGAVSTSPDGSMYTGDPVDVRLSVRLAAQTSGSGAPERPAAGPPPRKKGVADLAD